MKESVKRISWVLIGVIIFVMILLPQPSNTMVVIKESGTYNFDEDYREIHIVSGEVTIINSTTKNIVVHEGVSLELIDSIVSSGLYFIGSDVSLQLCNSKVNEIRFS